MPKIYSSFLCECSILCCPFKLFYLKEKLITNLYRIFEEKKNTHNNKHYNRIFSVAMISTYDIYNASISCEQPTELPAEIELNTSYYK